MKNNNRKIFLKVIFYFMSLWLLFLLASIITFKIEPDKSIKQNLQMNFFSLVLMGLSVLSFSLNFVVKDKTKSAANPSYTVKKVENKNYEFLTFLTTYIIPLVFINFNNKNHIIVIILLLIFTGIVFTKMDLYLANPTLALFYKLYEIQIETNSGDRIITVISKDKLKESDEIEWIPFDERCWFVRRK